MAIDRRKRPLSRTSGELRDASLFIVATEGEKTEPHYFSIFRSSKLKVITLACEDGHSSPEGVLKRISDFKERYQFGRGDSFWLAVDRDKWTVKSLSSVHADCKKKAFTLLVSNPRFEIWLALHFEDEIPSDLSAKSLAKHMKKVFRTFTKSKFPLTDLLDRSQQACDRARALDQQAENDIWPNLPGSRVYLLVEQILERAGIAEP